MTSSSLAGTWWRSGSSRSAASASARSSVRPRFPVWSTYVSECHVCRRRLIDCACARVCAVADALVPTMTVREHLVFFARVKGIPQGQQLRHKVAAAFMRLMELTQYSEKMVGRLSGGNRRKLSLAIAMLANPRVVFLDEPSTGMGASCAHCDDCTGS